MREAILALDAGGTSIKLSLVESGKEPAGGTAVAFEGDTKDALLTAFRKALLTGQAGAERLGCRIAHVGIACPGPFDFFHGVSLMTHKWAGIRGVPLKPVIAEVFPGVPLSFLHDSTAFMLGEAFAGAAGEAQNPAGIMLGTGIGYAFMKNRRVCLDETLSPLVRLWRLPYRDGTVEDYVSRRAIRKRYGDKRGLTEAPDVQAIAAQASAGEPEALAAFRETGALLGSVLRIYLDAACDLVVIGGQIARSAALFLPETQKALTVPVMAATHIDNAAIRGISVFCTHQDVTAVSRNG